MVFALDSVWHITTQLNYYLFCYVHLQTSVDALVQACVVVDMVDEASIIGNNHSSCNIHPFATRTYENWTNNRDLSIPRGEGELNWHLRSSEWKLHASAFNFITSILKSEDGTIPLHNFSWLVQAWQTAWDNLTCKKRLNQPNFPGITPFFLWA